MLNRIKIIDVGTPSSHQSANGLDYQAIEVIFRDSENQVVSKRLFSFRNRNVFKAAGSWTKGTEIDVVVEDDAKGYAQWVDFDIVKPSVEVTDGEFDDVPL